MITRQEGQATLYDDAKDTFTSNGITALPTTLSSKSLMNPDGKTATEYSEETTTQRDLMQLQEHFE